MAETTKTETPAGAATPGETIAPAPPANPFAHTVEAKNWETMTLLSTLMPGGVLRCHRPSLDEEESLRYLIRKTARARGMNPDDLDGTIYDSLYLRAFFDLCVDEPEDLDYGTLTPKGRRQHEALQSLQLEVFAWLSLFRDDETDGGAAVGV